MFRFSKLAAAVLGLAVPLLAGNPTVTQRSTFNEGWFCSTFTYCYEIYNPADCKVPVDTFCVKFHLGVGLLDEGSIESPPGWSYTINQATNEICWTATVRASSVGTNERKSGFCVTTNCNPKGLEGLQDYRLRNRFGNLNLAEDKTLIALKTSHLGGDRDLLIGQPILVSASDGSAPHGMALVFLGLNRLPAPLQLPGIGALHLDPVFLLPVAQMQLDANGTGSAQVLLPPRPSLAGKVFPLQAVTVLSAAALSNTWDWKFH